MGIWSLFILVLCVYSECVVWTSEAKPSVHAVTDLYVFLSFCLCRPTCLCAHTKAYNSPPDFKHRLDEDLAPSLFLSPSLRLSPLPFSFSPSLSPTSYPLALHPPFSPSLPSKSKSYNRCLLRYFVFLPSKTFKSYYSMTKVSNASRKKACFKQFAQIFISCNCCVNLAS